MDESMKKRLLGLLLLIAALGVLLPLVLTGEGYRERQLQSQIPPPPAPPQVTEVHPSLPPLPDTSEYAPPIMSDVAVAKVEQSPETSVQERRPVVGVQGQPPQLDEDQVPVAWTLQLASFKDEANARALKKRLIGVGHKVYTRKQADLYKVYVGPDLQKERLEALKPPLKSDFGLDGIVVRFTTP